MQFLIDTDALLEQHAAASWENKWHIPFNLAVFGTLRQGWGNHSLMGDLRGDSQAEYRRRDRWDSRGRDYYHESHHRAFMPHWSPSGLSIHSSPNSSGVFEIYTYQPEDWAKMIVGVDRLEGFHPHELEGEKQYRWHRYGYYRTLAWLHVLPKHYASRFFDDRYYDDPRDLQIPVEKWNEYQKVPCWVYSSLNENASNLKLPDSPIIWPRD